MTSEIRANTLKNRVGLGTVSYTNTGIVVSGIVTANSFSGPFTGDIIGDGDLTLTSTDSGAAAAPTLKLQRDSSSPANQDVLGQIVFGGKDSTPNNEQYAMVAGKIIQAGAGGEHGAIQITTRKQSQHVITANLTSTDYQLLNGTNLSVDGDITGNGNFQLTSTDTGSAAAPELTLLRNSVSPADADYLGQIKFAGKHDGGSTVNYAKITGKILDASNGTEDGIIEFAHIKAGSQTITGRWRSDSLQLLNDTNLSVAGDTTLTGDLDVDGHTNLDNVSVAGVSTFSGVVRVPNGSAAAPAIHFGDSDTGLYGDASNGVRLTAGGSDKIVATTNGVTFPIKATALTSFTLGSQSALSKPLYFADAASVESASILLDNSSQELRIKNGRFSGQITFTTYNVERLRIKANGVIQFNGTNSADNTNKLVYLTTPSYDTDEEPFGFIHSGTYNNQNLLYFGGGMTSSYNACTLMKFYTTNSINTQVGTERLCIESWGGIQNNQGAIYGGGAANEPVVHFNGAGPSNDLERGHLAVSHNAAYNASPIARISLVTRYNSSGGYTFMGGIEGGKENTTDSNYDGFVRLVVRKHGQGNIERLRIDSSGQVSIGGNSTVGTKVHVENSSGDAHIRLRSSHNCGVLYTRHSDGALIGYTGSGNAVNLGSSNLGISASLSGGNIVFQTGGTGASNERVRIESGGEIRLLSENGNNSDTPGFTFRGGNSSQKANFARIHSRMVSNWGGQLQFKVKDDNGSLSDAYQTAMIINHNAYVTKPLTPAFFATHTTASSSITGTLTYNTSGNGYYNNGGHLDVSSGRFHAPVDGIYHFHFHGFFQSGQSNSYYEVIMYRRNSNGGGATGLTRQYGYRDQATNQYGPSISMQCTCSLTAGQTVEVSTGGLSFHGANGWYFGGHLLG